MADALPPRTGLSARLRSVGHAVRGLTHMLVTQRNAWIHLAATVIVAGAAWFYEVGAVGWALLVLAMAAVWTAEALNTGLELLADATSPSFHPLVGKAKDVAAGAVLVVALAAVVIGALVFWPAISSS